MDIRYIILIVVAMIFTDDCFSQETAILKNCRIISIDTNSFFPDYFIIKTMTEKGRIAMLSYNENKHAKSEKCRIEVNGIYDLEVIELDSVPIFSSTLHENYSRDSSKFKGCSSHQLSCNLTGRYHAVGYYSYTRPVMAILGNGTVKYLYRISYLAEIYKGCESYERGERHTG